MFENILGHEKQKQFLENSIISNNISHSYLFLGSDGIGKKCLAIEFAKILLNANSIENCPDFKIIEKKKDKKNVLVEQIREDILKDIYIAPISSDKKVYIIDNFEELSISSQNALLKTLEEPPKYVVIIIISSNITNILTTILSRVNIVRFDKLSIKIIKKYINNEEMTQNILNFLDGSIGKYNLLLENNSLDKLELIDKLYNFITSKNYISCIKIIEEIDFNYKYMFEYLTYLMSKNNNNLCVSIVEKSYLRLQNNGNYDIVIDNMILKCIDNIDKI